MSLTEEAALVLGRDTVLLTQMMGWCETKEHGGVKGEASRLLAALIRHSRSPVSPPHLHIQSRQLVTRLHRSSRH